MIFVRAAYDVAVTAASALFILVVVGFIISVLDRKDEQNNRLFETKCEQAGFTTEQCWFFRNGAH